MPPKKRKSGPVILSESATPAPDPAESTSASTPLPAGTPTTFGGGGLSALAQARTEAALIKEALIEAHTYMYVPRPFKNPNYTKNKGRRMRNYKAVLLAERERDVAAGVTEPTYLSIEAPPSLMPQQKYCDITGLEGPYTDPATNLRYHDKSVYEFIKGMNPGTEKFYLQARGVNPIVK